MKKLISFLLCLGLLLAPSAAVANSVDTGPPVIAPYYMRVGTAYATLSIRSGTATCTGYMDSMYGSDKISFTITLRKKVGTSWSYVDSWSASGTRAASTSSEKSISSGTYKLFLSGTATSTGGAVESASKESAEVTF